MIRIEAPNIAAHVQRFKAAPNITNDMIKWNFLQLGKQIAQEEIKELEPVKYRGTLARSVSYELDIAPPLYTLDIGPTAPHAIFILEGTRPHWVPIDSLKEWARWKLGDEKKAYAVRASIARHGTSVWIERRGLGDGRGGFPFPTRTLVRNNVRTWIERTGIRLGIEISKWLES